VRLPNLRKRAEKRVDYFYVVKWDFEWKDLENQTVWSKAKMEADRYIAILEVNLKTETARIEEGGFHHLELDSEIIESAGVSTSEEFWIKKAIEATKSWVKRQQEKRSRCE
jgi:hypothetical protein